MKIWELRISDKNMAIRPRNNEYNPEIGEHFKGQSMKDWWTPIQMEVYRKGNNVELPYLEPFLPIFTQKHIEQLDLLISDHVEYLEILLSESTPKLYLVNVITVLDALDYNRSIIEWSPWGRISYINKFIFNEDTVRGIPIFKIKEKPKSYVFVSDEFRNLVLNSKLKGFEFVEVWDSEFTVEKEQEQKNRYAAKLAEIERTKGPEFDWAEAYKRIEQGHAVRSGKWKLQMDKQGTLLIGHLSEEDCNYYWTDPIYIPPILLDLKWHDTEKSDIS